jgi:Zn-dependent protease
VASVRVWATPSAIAWYMGLACLSTLGARRCGASATGGLVAGTATSLGHLVCLGVHHAGHALEGRRAGHPLVAIRLWGPLANDVYRPDEPVLTRGAHARRALSGPLASLLLTGVLLLLAARIRPASLAARQVTLFVCLDNLLVFCLGALWPMSFTDGGTLRESWRK